jgi:hypothetical protein
MAMKKALRTSVRRAPGFARWTITLFVFLAFSFQSYVTQTHIHFQGEAAVNIFASSEKFSSAATAPGKQNPDKYPPADDPANCPICQEVMHSGAFVMPDFIALLLPSQPISIIPIVIALPTSIQAVSHRWQGRAPPHA